MKCKATIEFVDDYGNSSCTFHCDLEEGHKGPHREIGINYGVHYTIAWGMAEPEKAKEVPIEEMVKV